MGNSVDPFSSSKKYRKKEEKPTKTITLKYVSGSKYIDKNKKVYMITWGNNTIQLPTGKNSRTKDLSITPKAVEGEGFEFTVREHRYFAKKPPPPQTDETQTGAAQPLRL